VSFLWITIPATLVLAASLLLWVLHEVRRGGLDDLDAPAEHAALDDDSVPERGLARLSPAVATACESVEPGRRSTDSSGK
jgi:nitrogen fixation-related uncharacterized protein